MSGQKALKGFIGPPVEFSKRSHREHSPVSRLWEEELQAAECTEELFPSPFMSGPALV